MILFILMVLVSWPLAVTAHNRSNCPVQLLEPVTRQTSESEWLKQIITVSFSGVTLVRKVGDQARGVFIKWGSVPHSKKWIRTAPFPLKLRLWSVLFKRPSFPPESLRSGCIVHRRELLDRFSEAEMSDTDGALKGTLLADSSQNWFENPSNIFPKCFVGNCTVCVALSEWFLVLLFWY